MCPKTVHRIAELVEGWESATSDTSVWNYYFPRDGYAKLKAAISGMVEQSWLCGSAYHN